MLELQYLTTSVSGAPHAYPHPVNVFDQMERILMREQFTPVKGESSDKLTCKDVEQPALFRPLRILAGCT